MNSTAFPTGFMWGAATAAHQIEGNNANSDYWFLEQVENTAFKEPSGIACDSYNRWSEDLAIVEELGLNSYRFSVEWARLEPVEGTWDSEAFDHYREILKTLKLKGIKAMVTLSHFTSPIWLFKKGGWEFEGTPELFARYAEKVVQEFGDFMDSICTLNEPNLPILLEYLGIFSPDPKAREAMPMWVSAGKALGVSPQNITPYHITCSPKSDEIRIAAHKLARQAIKRIRTDIAVGWTLANVDAQGDEASVLSFKEKVNIPYLRIASEDDFVGVQTYTRLILGADGRPSLPPEGAERSQTGDEYYPVAIGHTIREAWQYSGVPVVVTENGIATENDELRVRFYTEAVKAVADCLRDGVDVQGYFAWSLMDNYEWIFGYEPKFGIVHVDRKTLNRTIKPSGYLIGEFAETNGAGI